MIQTVLSNMVLETLISDYLIHKYRSFRIERVRVTWSYFEIQIEIVSSVVWLLIGKKGVNKKEMEKNLIARFPSRKPYNIKFLSIQDVSAENHIPSPESICNEIVQRAIFTGGNFRKTISYFLNKLKSQGVPAVYFTLKGIVRGKRASKVTFGYGNFKVSGSMQSYITKYSAQCVLKMGVVNVKLLMVAPGIKLPDTLEMRSQSLSDQ